MKTTYRFVAVRRPLYAVLHSKYQKKHRCPRTPNYCYEALQPDLVVMDRRRPRIGYRHALTKSDVYRFLQLLPEWEALAVGLNAIVLTEGEDCLDGWYRPGVVAVCAWSSAQWKACQPWYYQAHREIFARLGIKTIELPDGYVCCEWMESAVRAYQLLHILLPELGHHYDLMTTRRQKYATRGESYAEDYALRHEALLWDAYLRAFPEW